jgi:hypothetical protein
VSESTLMIVLRLIHIICGVFWAGTAMTMAWFLLPTQRAMGQPGGAFIRELMLKQKLRNFVVSAMALTVLSGLFMYIRMSVITHGVWSSSRMGITLGIGGLAAIIAGGIGAAVTGRFAPKLMQLGETVQASGGPPTEAQRVEMEALGKKIQGGFRIIAILLLIAVAAMASARYL